VHGSGGFEGFGEAVDRELGVSEDLVGGLVDELDVDGRCNGVIVGWVVGRFRVAFEGPHEVWILVRLGLVSKGSISGEEFLELGAVLAREASEISVGEGGGVD
jgi:hypothetical protein